jgi:hypothetical protein
MWDYGWTKAQLLNRKWQIEKTYIEPTTWDCGNETKNIVDVKVDQVESARNRAGNVKEV